MLKMADPVRHYNGYDTEKVKHSSDKIVCNSVYLMASMLYQRQVNN
jgi:hypothetical protein